MLVGKVAIVTGAGQGVGQGIALALANHGAKVAAMGRTGSKVEETCRLIGQRGGVALPIEGNVKDLDDLEACVDRVVGAFGGIQILVNNAQEVPLGPLLGVTEEALEAGWESGPRATFRMMKLCYPHLKGDGCIVNLASTVARRWDATNYGAYAAVKEAIRAFSRAAASEWGGEGIRTNVILPHAKSPALAAWTEANPEEAAAFVATIPMRRIGECEEDVGEFVAFLCSSAAAYVNGQSIAVDGGQAYMP
ncbi:MAG: SDR family oxidoreductase [Myxococcota bacterium]|jgi:NAD(P)-dependent dehydrogenase (short-subunit alcohol dehydrogenase family)|nr:3-oxoacyl-ACP reductase [Deltaproteobacteria bacterium]MCP4244799.1 SDR family oxidoreductase [bacterium]MDP6074214.1 SDR family oxidoreductase [Myxococcota bacterium]MDP7075810.1 SDR family oxidoreductase [Myxococcota bacterium]MDP7298560.1 SDR family oxidoreductase [Myxococcota bacterium]